MAKAAAAFSLLVCLAAPFLFFWGQITNGTFRAVYALSSLAWFVFATMSIRGRAGGS